MLAPDCEPCLRGLYPAVTGFMRDLARGVADLQQVIAHLMTVDSQQTSLQRCTVLRYSEPQENILHPEAQYREFL